MKSPRIKQPGKGIAPFYFEAMPPGRFLITNDWGGWSVLDESDFYAFAAGGLGGDHAKYPELAAGGFFLQPSDFIGCSEKFNKLHASVFAGTTLHIVVLTIRCNQKCVYCHASAKSAGEKRYDMGRETARQTVDFIFSSPGKDLIIEFQGGEPFLNWEVLKFAVKYAKEKAAKLKKSVEFKLVSNLSSMDEEKFRFIFENKIGLAASLDGPAALHDSQRVYASGSSHAQAAKWIKKFNSAGPRYLKIGYVYRLTALATVTRQALRGAKALVDEYLRLGLREIYARPLNPFGFSEANWRRIGYSAPEYLAFYRELLEYLISLDAKGVKIREKTAQNFLAKILEGSDPANMDCRMICGAAVGQMAYNYNGDIYTCDEGRMLSVMGDESFRLGNVADTSYAQALESPVTKTLCVASCLESLPGCSDCAFKPFCGVCPVNSYFYGSLFPQRVNDQRCAINKGVLKIIFEKMSNPGDRAVLTSWLGSNWYRNLFKKR
ncbi:MAG: His-Xaa-Ser system radical SAM maturase HxsB [Elusimicrobia bacterium GWF2_52_66]|nr:MAG: His-Xaa-Ser system radical SAM maturase HxsB [Elusimicrobia bacterium GWA2_51_34]OGR88079.1 MAG: His-Xaa-Ser system radical SAM maturase HxsB [Elusimicrobia bacterium GWF2_52_66]HAF95752.1 His-Xaa-Ser system radical SAM maturase HxsB [Elusimicrobiota bacterium]HCE97735.1 His-Xaa-Ser system radical SAM maturase HxsB [Elusimicrobiota bacterium]